MKPNRRTVILAVLSALALAWWGKVTVGTIELAYYQGITWSVDLFAPHARVPVVLAVVELSLILIASLIPLVAALKDYGQPRWVAWVWAPCIVYVLFMSVNLFVHGPFGVAACIRGGIRLFAWVAIAVLFLGRRRTAS